GPRPRGRMRRRGCACSATRASPWAEPCPARRAERCRPSRLLQCWPPPWPPPQRMDTPAEETVEHAGTDERIVAALLARGRLKEADLGRARRLQEETGGSLLELLGRLGLVSERDHAEACADVLGLPLASAKDLPELPPEGTPLTHRFMTRFHVVPVAEDEAEVHVLAADPQDPYALDAVGLASGKAVRASVALRSEIADLIERWHGQGRSAMGAIVETAEGEGGDIDDVEHLRDLASEAPVIRLVNLVIQRAVELRAS